MSKIVAFFCRKSSKLEKLILSELENKGLIPEVITYTKEQASPERGNAGLKDFAEMISKLATADYAFFDTNYKEDYFGKQLRKLALDFGIKVIYNTEEGLGNIAISDKIDLRDRISVIEIEEPIITAKSE